MPVILLVEDEPDVRSSFQDALESLLGAEVPAYGDAESAQAALDPAAVDIVITDERLPGMAGCDFVRWLREQGFSGPCIVMSAFGTEGDMVQRAEAAGARFLPKPTSLAQLLAVLEPRSTTPA